MGVAVSALMPHQRRGLAWIFFPPSQGLPQGSAGYVLLLHLVATNSLEDLNLCRRNYPSLRLRIVTLVSLPDERRWFGVAIGRYTGTATQTINTMLETTRYLQTQSANKGVVCLFTEPPSNPN